ncbi:FtsK/SpoIIIE domain-containing protein [Oerskovia enterophila]|uniref:FtsK/SpoIIIE domain-containing protein n=1 Tax=Oerskovia enterophila TaxID=43678 RepID=UPI003811296D
MLVVPALRVRWRDGLLTLRPRLLVGQTVEDYLQAAERFRQTFGATRVHVISNGECVVTLSFSDTLAHVVPRPRPQLTAEPEIGEITMGIAEDGVQWRLRLAGTHTLVAGCSGSGKASLVWGVSLGLAPAVHSGVVQLWGVDLKGGMELSMGRPLFTCYATEPEEAVALLEEAVQRMRKRAARLAGVTRQHTPSAADPFVVVLIDEVAALTAYLNDRDLKRRANDALALLCSQGRALGVSVVACLQDPRKEVLGMRGLFTQTVGLRLRDREETAMVLGDGAVASGAACHTIPATSPGVAFVVPPEGGTPVRVRAWRVDDETIRYTAALFAAPVQIPVVVKQPATDASAPRRRSRQTQESAA